MVSFVAYDPKPTLFNRRLPSAKSTILLAETVNEFFRVKGFGVNFKYRVSKLLLPSYFVFFTIIDPVLVFRLTTWSSCVPSPNLGKGGKKRQWICPLEEA
jgi:hypothetical protein